MKRSLDYSAVKEEQYSQLSLSTLFVIAGVLLLVLYSLYAVMLEAGVFNQVGNQTRAKISWYWPPLLGVNCATARNGECVSRMASGQPWQDWVGRAVACPEEFPFGTVFVIDGRRWVCMDRGGAVKRVNSNLIWLDMLTSKPLYKYGTVVDVTIIR